MVCHPQIEPKKAGNDNPHVCAALVHAHSGRTTFDAERYKICDSWYKISDS